MAIIFTVFGFLFLFLDGDAVVINTKQGSLRGLVFQSRNGAEYHAFMGIPFAKPPIGELRLEVNFMIFDFPSITKHVFLAHLN